MTEPTKNSKAAELLAASRARAAQAAEAEKELAAKSALEEQEKKPEVVEAKIEAAEEVAETLVQAKAGTMTGEIDVEAMGDVKGDGRDAKDYPDTDRDKHLGIPVYEHGLNRTGDDLSAGVHGARTNSRREAEIALGRARIAEIQKNRDDNEARRVERKSPAFETTVTEPTAAELRAAKKANKARK